MSNQISKEEFHTHSFNAECSTKIESGVCVFVVALCACSSTCCVERDYCNQANIYFLILRTIGIKLYQIFLLIIVLSLDAYIV